MMLVIGDIFFFKIIVDEDLVCYKKRNDSLYFLGLRSSLNK